MTPDEKASAAIQDLRHLAEAAYARRPSFVGSDTRLRWLRTLSQAEEDIRHVSRSVSAFRELLDKDEARLPRGDDR